MISALVRRATTGGYPLSGIPTLLWLVGSSRQSLRAKQGRRRCATSARVPLVASEPTEPIPVGTVRDCSSACWGFELIRLVQGHIRMRA